MKTTLYLILVIASSAVFVNAQSGPLAAVKAFYAYDRTHPQTFSRRNIDARKRWFDTSLYKLFLKELDRERVYLKQNPTDKPHFGDGLPFQPLDETCDLNGKSFKRQITYGTVTVKREMGNVDVHFKYPKGCNIPDVLYAVNMDKEKGRWVITDIRYFPENGSLVEDLNRKEY